MFFLSRTKLFKNVLIEKLGQEVLTAVQQDLQEKTIERYAAVATATK